MVAARIQRFERLAVSAVLWALVAVGSSQAITMRVPQDYAKITDALLWAANDDVIVVSPGIYTENVSLLGKNVVLRSTNPTSPGVVAATIIDGNKADCVVRFAGTETSGCVLSGFTIRNGAYYNGGGIYGSLSWARIERNVISGNSGNAGGGLYQCNGTIQYNVITGNSASYGGGLCTCNGTIQNNAITSNSVNGWGGGLDLCNGTIQNNVIAGNSADSWGGGLSQCNGTIQNNVITSNSAGLFSVGIGGGLCQCGGLIRNNTITSNSAVAQGGGLSGCTGVIVNSIIWGNTALAYPQISPDSIPSYSCIQGYTVGHEQGNIGLDPRFAGPDDFHLRRGSPCIDAGTNQNCPATDKDGTRRPLDGNGDGRATCDMGAYEYPTVPRTAVHQEFWMLYR